MCRLPDTVILTLLYISKEFTRETELLATLVAMQLFGWFDTSGGRKALEVSLFGGTDNRANESLSEKRSTTKWPLMGINMQLSSMLSRSRLSLGLRWRPRDKNTRLGSLGNGRFGPNPGREPFGSKFRQFEGPWAGN